MRDFSRDAFGFTDVVAGVLDGEAIGGEAAAADSRTVSAAKIFLVDIFLVTWERCLASPPTA